VTLVTLFDHTVDPETANQPIPLDSRKSERKMCVVLPPIVQQPPNQDATADVEGDVPRILPVDPENQETVKPQIASLQTADSEPINVILPQRLVFDTCTTTLNSSCPPHT
jgi:hypothetical protein